MEPRPRLLFVDDEPSLRLLVPALLERHGFDVTIAATVNEALNLITTQRFDVLLSDLNIGEPGDGFTVVSAMRRTEPSTATFILTGYPAFETALEAIRQQVDDYFVKPADVEEGEPVVAKHMQGQNWHYLRFPNLSVATGERHEQMMEWMKSKGYREADISAAFNDWNYTGA